jgi:hypothetical protein
MNLEVPSVLPRMLLIFCRVCGAWFGYSCSRMWNIVLLSDILIALAKKIVHCWNDYLDCLDGLDVVKECYLVDPASSHMLVSKIKPCMCKYELIQTVKLRMAH